jgi:hypothetical protein
VDNEPPDREALSKATMCDIIDIFLKTSIYFTDQLIPSPLRSYEGEWLPQSIGNLQSSQINARNLRRTQTISGSIFPDKHIQNRTFGLA